MMVAFGIIASAQVTVTNPANTTPGLAATYTDLALAITDLNAQTAISGPVTITLTAGNPQTAPAGGYSISALLTGASAVNTVTIDGSANTITAGVGVSTTTDAIFKLIGVDFLTLQGFTMQESVGNVTTTTQIEWGVALLYATTTNGAQNITVQNNTITLNRTNANTFGIYANATHTATSVGTSATATGTLGGNTGLKVYGNNISNVNQGIVVVGPTAAADANTGIDIGGTGGVQTNTITNFGTTTTASYINVSGTVNGILVRNSNGSNISFNTVTSSVGGTTVGTLNGIQIPAASTTPTGTFTNTINSNNISLQSGLLTGAINGISYPSGSASATSTLNINNNNFNTFGHTVAASGTITFINDTSTNQFTTINSNTFTNMSVNTTGSVTFISQSFTAPSTGTKAVNNNSIVTGFTKTGAGGTVTFVADNGSTVSGAVSNCQNNNFSNVSLTGATAITGISYTDGGSAPTRTVTGNTLNNLTTGAATINAMNFTYWNGVSILSNNTVTNITGQGAITGITIGSTVNTATSATISSNTVTNLTSTGTGGTVIGISSSNTSPVVNLSSNLLNTLSTTGTGAVTGILVSSSTLTTVSKNKIYNLENTNTLPVASGITVSSGSTVTLQNNLVGDIRTPNSGSTNSLFGINISGGTTVNAFFNSVYLNATSVGANFGSSAINVASTTTATLRNNIFVNNSTAAGTGFAVAHRRSSATLTTYAAASNNNDFFATTIYTDGVTPQVSIAAYKALVASRDSASFAENPTFVSTTGSSSNFLHINLLTPTQLESGGTTVSGITDDFDGDTRNVTTPDIGADEFIGTPLDLTGPSITYTALVNTSSIIDRGLTVTITDPSGIAGGTLAPRIYYRKNAGTYFSSQCMGSSPTYTCTIVVADVGGVVTTDIIGYFVVAQDTPGNLSANPSGGFVGTNVNTVTTPPTTPNQYTIINGITGSQNVGTGETYTSLTNTGGIFEAINAAEVTGNVTINLTSDLTAELGTIALNQFATGFSVTIQPSGGVTRQIIGSNSTTALIGLNGADNVIIDGLNTGGNSLLIRNTGTTPTIRYINDASTNILRNSTIEGASTTANVNISTGTTTGNDDIQILNNTIRDRSDAVGVPFNAVHSVGTNLTGNSNTNITVTNNQIFNFTQAGFLSANSENISFTQNTIYQTAPRTTALSGVAVNSALGTNLFSRNVVRDLTTTLATNGMVFNDARATTVSRNWIYNIPSTSGSTATLTGIVFNGGSGTAANVTVANNFVSIVPAFTNAQITRGILDFAFTGNTFTSFYNSVLLDGTASGTTNSFACGRLFSAPTAFTFQNNVCFNNRTGGTGNHYAMSDQSANTGTFVSDYNMFVGTGATAANFYDYGTSSTGTPVSYTAWQTGPPTRDANSIQSNPGIGNYTVLLTFVSQTDLHTKLTSPGVDKGIAVSVLDDFDGSIRSVVGFAGGIPDIGGDEFVAPSAATASVRGRLISGFGRNLANANVSITNTATGEILRTRSNQLGYFNFRELGVGDIYVVEVQSKRFRFENHTFTLNEDLTDLVLTAQ